MKRVISGLLAAAVLASLTACGGAPATPSHTDAPSPSATPSKLAVVVPDLKGKSYYDASVSLGSLGLKSTFVGKDGKKWSPTTRNPGTKDIILSTNPAAGTSTETGTVELTLDHTDAEVVAADKAAEEAAALAVRYAFKCSAGYGSSTGGDVYHSLKEVWASKHYAGGDKCDVSIEGASSGTGTLSNISLLPQEKAIADIVAKPDGKGSGGTPGYNFYEALKLCTKVDANYVDDIPARMDWKKADAEAALALCPDAPHAAKFTEVLTSVKVDDGTHVVGQSMEAGTYKTKPNAKDCYWSRTTGAGAIIANDFVGFAPEGVTVTVYPGEGFESERCGVWTKIG